MENPSLEFQRGMDPRRSLDIGRTIEERLKSHPICKILNNPFKNMDRDKLKSPSLRVYIEPKNKFSFKSATYSVDDLEDWMLGRGEVIKGNTPNEKAKYWEYAIAEEENIHIFSIRYFWKWFDKIEADNKIIRSFSSDGSYRVHKPISIPAMTNGDSKKERDGEVIAKVLSHIIKELEGRYSSDDPAISESDINNKYRDVLKGVCDTLILFGIGYWGNNLYPEEMANLSWSTELALSKIRYDQLLAGGVKLPDFEWLSKGN